MKITAELRFTVDDGELFFDVVEVDTDENAYPWTELLAELTERGQFARRLDETGVARR